MIENWAKIIYIHDNEVKIIAECNLIYNIINPPKCDKNINNHYSPILNGFINIRKVEQSSKTSEFYWIVDVVPQLWLEV